MSRINIDFNSILQPIKDAQNELTKLLSQMQEASQASRNLASGMRSSGGPRFSSIEAAANYTKNMRAIHGDNVIAMPGVPFSNLDPSQQISSSTNNPINPVAQAARANVVSNLDAVSFGRALNDSASLVKQGQTRQELISNLMAGDRTSKYFGNQLQEAGITNKNLKIEMEQASRQALDENGKLIKDNAEAVKRLTDAIKKLEKSNDELASIQDEANRFLKSGGGGGGGEGSGSTPGGLRGIYNRIGGAVGITKGIAATIGIAGTALNAYGQLVQKDAMANLNTQTNLGAANAALFQQQMAAAAPMSGRDILRSYGNLMAPDLVGTNSYLGQGGLGRAQRAAKAIQEQRLSGSSMSFWGGLAASAGTGAAVAVGAAKVPALMTAAMSGGVAAPLSGIMLAGAAAAGAVTAGAGYLWNNGSEWLRSQGGYAGVIGMDAGKRAQQQYRSERQLEEVSLANQMQENELNSLQNLRRARGLDTRTAALATQRAGTSLVGGMSTSGLDLMAGGNLSTIAANIEKDRAIASDNKNYSMSERKAALARLQKGPLDRAMRIGADTLMDPAEYAQAGNLLTSVIGRKASEGETTSFAKMRFAGVGSTEQLASQMLGLQGATNTPLSLSEFKKTLSEGVAAGFSTAPLMQAFMGTLTQLSQNMGITNVNATAGDLNLLSTGLSVTGRGGVRSLREAAAAMGSLANYTGQTGGLVGMLKSVAGYSSGLGIRGGLEMANTMNYATMAESQNVFQQIAGSSNPIASLQKMEREGKISTDQARLVRLNINNIGGLAQSMKAMGDAARAPIRGAVNLALGGTDSYSNISEQMKNLLLSGKGRSEEFKTLEAKLAAAIQSSGVDRNTALLMVKEDMFAGMSPEQRERTQKLLTKSGGAFAAAQAEGAAKAKEDKFFVAQKALNARLGVEAALNTGGFADEATLKEAAKETGIDIATIKKQLGNKDGKVLAQDLAGFLSMGAGQQNAVTINGFSTQALTQFTEAINSGGVKPQVQAIQPNKAPSAKQPGE